MSLKVARSQVQTPRPAAEPKKPEAKLTVRDVPHTTALATRYTLDTGYAPGRSTEEMVEYLKRNLDAAKKSPKDPETAKRISHNVHFALGELENRTGPGPLRDNLYAARQAASRGERIDAAALSQVTTALAQFTKATGIEAKVMKWDPEVFKPAEQLGRFRGSLTELNWSLGRVQMTGIDEPDFRQKMPNHVQVFSDALSSVTVPTDPQAKAVFARTVAEMTSVVKNLMTTAESFDRKDIIASGNEALARLAKMA